MIKLDNFSLYWTFRNVSPIHSPRQHTANNWISMTEFRFESSNDYYVFMRLNSICMSIICVCAYADTKLSGKLRLQQSKYVSIRKCVVPAPHNGGQCIHDCWISPSGWNRSLHTPFEKAVVLREPCVTWHRMVCRLLPHIAHRHSFFHPTKTS